MLIFFDQNLAFLAVPKTGTTAYEVALRGRADILYSRRPGLKHMSARRFHESLAPYLKRAHRLQPERMAVMREPLDHLRSWYRYRHKPVLDGTPRSAKGMSFDDFVLEAIKPEPADVARVGTQHRFLTGEDDQILVHHIFAYERPTVLRGFLNDVFGEDVSVGVRNKSENVPAEVSPEVAARFRAARAQDYALYDAVAETGHLQNSIDGTPHPQLGQKTDA